MNKTTTVLRAKDIAKTYSQVDGSSLAILDKISLEIKSGEIVALVGVSGSGKSTLLHILGLLDRADTGNLFIHEQEVTSLKDSERTKIRRSDIGFVYQFHHLLPEFSAMENVSLPQIIDGKTKIEANKRSMSLLGQLKIAHRANNRPAKLSGGEQQRVAIARALANSPKLLLADEPTGNLDPDTAKEVFQIFMDVVRKTGVGALIATHNMDLAKSMDRVIEII